MEMKMMILKKYILEKKTNLYFFKILNNLKYQEYF